MKLGGLLRPYPVNISPKDLVLKINESRELWGRSKGIRVFSRTQEIEFKHASDSRGFRTGLEARELQQRTRSLLAIKCAKNEVENPSHKGTKRGDGIDSKSREGTRRLGPPFAIKSTRVLTQTTFKSTLKR